MVFHVQWNIFPWKSTGVLPNSIEILSKAEDTPECRLLFSNHKQHVKLLNIQVPMGLKYYQWKIGCGLKHMPILPCRSMPELNHTFVTPVFWRPVCGHLSLQHRPLRVPDRLLEALEFSLPYWSTVRTSDRLLDVRTNQHAFSFSGLPTCRSADCLCASKATPTTCMGLKWTRTCTYSSRNWPSELCAVWCRDNWRSIAYYM